MAVADLRSDTVTRPTPEMRRAMAEAEVGDDVYGEDPTVHALEVDAAALLGKEAALFVPSGTMGNQVAILCHTERGDEILAHSEAHVGYYEAGGPAWLAGVMLRGIPGPRGIFGPEDVEAALRPPDVHFPRPRLLCLENTHNRGGGKVWEIQRLQQVAETARRHGLAVHLDGARLWNAAVALERPVAELAAPADSVLCCLSKGLGAPVGSVLAGPAPWIARARRYRKGLGGGMRQAGVVAAAGLVAIRTMIPRLAEDHANARQLAEDLSAVRGLGVRPEDVETNMVMVGTGERPAAALVETLRGVGVLVGAMGPHTLRLVTHYDVGRAACQRAVTALAGAVAG